MLPDAKTGGSKTAPSASWRWQRRETSGLASGREANRMAADEGEPGIARDEVRGCFYGLSTR
jgi:hypothetical protein